LTMVIAMSDHNRVVNEIKEAFEERGFLVQIRGNNLPREVGRDEAIYRPDMLVKDRKNGDIVWIVEVETSQAGKAVVGAAALAEICMRIEKTEGRQKETPYLLFVFYTPSAKLQLANKRLKRLFEDGKIEHLRWIEPMHKKQAIEEIRRLD